MKILFVPVSSSQGIGEYMRSTILADTIQKEWPNAEIKFVLSQQAPYVGSCDYDVYLTEKSPTFHPKEVNRYIDEFKPDLVIFDAAGRASNLKHAKKTGAKTVFLAHYDKKIKRALKLNRLYYTDQVWVSQPEIAVSSLSWFSNVKLKYLNKEPLQYLGSIYQQPNEVEEREVLKKYNLVPGKFMLVSAGSGGHTTESGELAADVFYQAIKQSAITTKIVQVWGANYSGTKAPKNSETECHIRSLSNIEFIGLLKAAKMSLLSGGDTLLQAISLRAPLLTVPVSSDQPARIKTLLKFGNPMLSSASSVDAIANGLDQLNETEVRESLIREMERLNIKNGNKIALKNIRKLIK